MKILIKSIIFLSTLFFFIGCKDKSRVTITNSSPDNLINITVKYNGGSKSIGSLTKGNSRIIELDNYSDGECTIYVNNKKQASLSSASSSGSAPINWEADLKQIKK